MKVKEALKKCTDLELEEELERRQVKNDIPKKFKDIDFQPLIKFIENAVNNVAESGYPGKDCDVYAFEMAVECMYPKREFWDWWNKNVDY